MGCIKTERLEYQQIDEAFPHDLARRITAQSLLSVRNFLREARRNKPIEDWTVQEIIEIASERSS